MKNVLIVLNPARPAAIAFGRELVANFDRSGFSIQCNHSDILIGTKPVADIANLEAVIVLGGDGTILRAAEIIRGHQVPIIGINLGHVGFLAEITQPTIDEIVNAVAEQKIHREPRLVLKYVVLRNGEEVTNGWALNEVTVERNDTQMLELFVQIDQRPLSKWGCDGVICATPTGSTAYAFSAGGPVVWPDVDAFLLLPLAAHALFSRPMVVSPESEIVIEVVSQAAQISADGLRQIPLEIGDRVLLTRDSDAIQLAYVNHGNFTDRLVAKFKLPVEGWRGDSN
jgi:NAD+ kinase